MKKLARVNVESLQPLEQFIGPEDNPKYFFTMTEIKKIGINPRTQYDTPAAVCSYPLTQDYYEKLIHKDGKELPFAGDKPYICLFTTSDKVNVMTSYSESDLEKDVKTLKRWFPEVLTKNFINSAFTSASTPTPIGKFWNLTRLIGLDIFQRTGETGSQIDSKQVIRTSGKDWAHLLRNLGYTNFYDPGTGLMYISEPYQFMVFDTTIIVPIDTYLNPFGKVIFKEVEDPNRPGKTIVQPANKIEKADADIFFKKQKSILQRILSQKDPILAIKLIIKNPNVPSHTKKEICNEILISNYSKLKDETVGPDSLYHIVYDYLKSENVGAPYLLSNSLEQYARFLDTIYMMYIDYLSDSAFALKIFNDAPDDLSIENYSWLRTTLLNILKSAELSSEKIAEMYQYFPRDSLKSILLLKLKNTPIDLIIDYANSIDEKNETQIANLVNVIYSDQNNFRDKINLFISTPKLENKIKLIILENMSSRHIDNIPDDILINLLVNLKKDGLKIEDKNLCFTILDQILHRINNGSFQEYLSYNSLLTDVINNVITSGNEEIKLIIFLKFGDFPKNLLNDMCNNEKYANIIAQSLLDAKRDRVPMAIENIKYIYDTIKSSTDDDLKSLLHFYAKNALIHFGLIAPAKPSPFPGTVTSFNKTNKLIKVAHYLNNKYYLL
jgi:hypothetical protein